MNNDDALISEEFAALDPVARAEAVDAIARDNDQVARALKYVRRVNLVFDVYIAPNKELREIFNKFYDKLLFCSRNDNNDKRLQNDNEIDREETAEVLARLSDGNRHDNRSDEA